MDVDVPQKPIHTWREFLRHLVIVTAGILIALSLENLVEAFQHRSLARQARTNLAEEIRSNREKLARFTSELSRYEKQRETAVQFAQDILTQRRSDLTSLSLDVAAIHLHHAAWQTATVTGALGHMPYPEVQKYAVVYDMQQQFEALMNATLKDFAIVGQPPPAAENIRAMEEWQSRLKADLGALRLQRSYAKSLDEIYGSALSR